MTYALDIKNVKKTYKNGVEAVKGVDLRIEQGDFFALLGHNGAGKSSLINMIAQLNTVTSGSIDILGVDIQKQPSFTKSIIGVMPQEVNLNMFETCWNNMRAQAAYYGLSYRKTKGYLETLLKQADLWDERHRQARLFSGGMKRRLMIARALVHRPKVLILDEPTAGVDVEMRQNMWGVIKSLNNNGTTIILTTHYLEEAEQLCNNIAIMNHGKIAVNVSKENLLSRLESEIVTLQLARPVPERPEPEGLKLEWVSDVQIDLHLHKTQVIGDVICQLSPFGVSVARVVAKATRLEQMFLHMNEGGSHESD
jgi:ABC-2 type transport system ATP-binding protein